MICAPVSGAQFAVGKTTVTCTAVDASGNDNAATFVVWVTYEAPTDGSFFLKPIRGDNSSVFRIGRAVPIKFRLAGASKDITNLVARVEITKISDTVRGTVDCDSDEDDDAPDDALTFAYRPGRKLYAYRWKTRGETRGTYRLRADLGDDVTHEVTVSLKTHH